MATIIREESAFEGRFTMLPNVWLRDRRLTRKARGLLAELHSHRVGWKVSEASLIAAGLEGRDAIRGALLELEECGYIERIQLREPSGVFSEVEYRTRDPFTVDGLSVDGLSDDGKSAPIRRPITKKTKSKNISIDDPRDSADVEGVPAPSQVEMAFSAFWSTYPRKVGKPVAEKAFIKAVERAGSSTLVLEGARRLRDDPNLPEKQFVPHPSTWLNRDGWEDEALPTRGGRPDPIAVGARVDAMLAAEESSGWAEVSS